MTSKGSRDTENWRNGFWEFSIAITGINNILKQKLQYYFTISRFHWIWWEPVLIPKKKKNCWFYPCLHISPVSFLWLSVWASLWWASLTATVKKPNKTEHLLWDLEIIHAAKFELLRSSLPSRIGVFLPERFNICELNRLSSTSSFEYFTLIKSKSF